MVGSKQDGETGSGKGGKDSNSTNRRPSKWDQKPQESKSQDRDGQPGRSGSGLPRTGGPTIGDLQQRTSKTADDGWGAPSSTRPLATGGGWGSTSNAWGTKTTPGPDGGGWGAPQTPTGDGGGWGRGANDARQGPTNAGPDGASQKAEAQGRTRPAGQGPPPPPPTGAPPKGGRDATYMPMTAGLMPARVQIPQMQGPPPTPPWPIMPPGWGQPAQMMGMQQMGMQPPMIGSMGMDIGGQGQPVMDMMQGSGLSMVPPTSRPLSARPGIEELWPNLMQAAQTAVNIAMSPIGSLMHPPGATPLQARQAMALQAHTPMQMMTMPGMTTPQTPLAQTQRMTAPAAAQGLQVPGIQLVTLRDARAAVGAQQYQMSLGTQAQRAGMYTEACTQRPIDARTDESQC